MAKPVTAEQILIDPALPISAKWFATVMALGGDLQSILDLDPETLLVELEQAIGRKLDSISRAKVIMGSLAYGSDRFYADLPAFNDFANYCWHQTPPPPGVYEPANSVECALAVAELMIINLNFSAKQEDDDLEFSDEIRKYWGAVLFSEGLLKPFSPLQLAVMPPLPEINEPAIFTAIDDTSRRVTISFQNEIRQRVLLALNLIAGLRSADGTGILTDDEVVNFMMAIVS